ncbi:MULTISPECIES: MGMT family protein [Methanobacterium]|uniref:methylated-DNA--[protein]-cysteine S-methyltransferase n=1 Tax=Methanobacterium veterum TaxID=408577 RepID=A0A9E5A2K9_9EURY|nr:MULTISPECIES: MGMT family protein [Methanobacterium]MCZ3366453.1 MGMT family protein [Methanobacterium veterum]MCZ3371961.1 MGMT family protein [Methanobacterium veterum]
MLDEISKEYTSFELSDEYEHYAKDVCMAYYGKKTEFEAVIPNKSDFKSKVLQEVAKIPYGEVRTYKQISESIGTKAYRAVGTAIGRNHLPIIIPCHRVVKSDLHVGGFFGGTEMKKEMLENEGICIVDGKIKK